MTTSRLMRMAGLVATMLVSFQSTTSVALPSPLNQDSGLHGEDRFFHRWADHASVFGVAISLVGFAFTLVGLARSRSASRQVAKAVAEVRQKQTLLLTVADLGRLVNDLEELKPLHRAELWAVLLPKYASIRRHLLVIKAKENGLSKMQRSAIQGAILQFADIERIVEQALSSKNIPPDIASLNKVVAEQSDKISGILATVQRNTGMET